ncbi:Deaminated glutathione amidase [Capillimicrobium parvum]|uniref:Deaminated glutathione amidase n=2 Tax=Capillimicrobium parvum TaxID=2884022 RepID=A0A9E7C2C8_9ACTN|nr:Deaminated glutathione amidase [Capillimicrobium parvum]
MLNVAVVQLHPLENKAANIDRAEGFIRVAAAAGARLVALPEYFSCYGRAVSPVSVAAVYGEAAETIPGPTTERLQALAHELGIHIHGGSFFERRGDALYNTNVIVDPAGDVLGVYRKIHLFEARAPELTYREESAVTPGTEIVFTDLEVDGRSTTVGQTICYDIRFPELYRVLVAEYGSEILFVPAAFPRETGRDHWELLLRARAVENQAFVVAPAQWGEQADGSWLHGRSMIVDPWGTVMATVPDGEGVAIASLDLDRLATYRQNYPNLQNRQPDVYSSSSKEVV